MALFEEVAVGSAAVGVSLLTNFHARTIIRLLGSKSLKLRYLIAFCNGLLAPFSNRSAPDAISVRTASAGMSMKRPFGQ